MFLVDELNRQGNQSLLLLLFDGPIFILETFLMIKIRAKGLERANYAA
jgi:hypothetical protein